MHENKIKEDSTYYKDSDIKKIISQIFRNKKGELFLFKLGEILINNFKCVIFENKSKNPKDWVQSKLPSEYLYQYKINIYFHQFNGEISNYFLKPLMNQLNLNNNSILKMDKRITYWQVGYFSILELILPYYSYLKKQYFKQIDLNFNKAEKDMQEKILWEKGYYKNPTDGFFYNKDGLRYFPD